ncbi:GHKL domain-containing protein [Candidatus Mycosynbacter amalyticus]|uniref:histidine kinase n=1 Tax=Candidatus Mycosynbacter amalyticus TaxID=2665156 RepID=A0A857MJU8_9BACT|nr:HAMP domain-containing sensor histidine kinase [Candidatus Mycosynbacter amalyticus]QHN42418.1 GHKL domain-containing protein [Candidatus Mycosynbacter amalyticus]
MYRKTAIRLTVQYSILLLAVLAVFSAGLYLWVDDLFDTQYIQEVENKLGTNDDLAVTEQQHRTVEAAAEVAVEQFRNVLLLADITAFALIPFASYAITRRSLKPLVEANESQKRFIANASHELRTPLAVMSGEFELALKKERDADYFRNTIISSKEELERLNRLTNQLMELQRIENNSHKAMTNMHPISTARLVQNVYEEHRKKFVSGGFEFANVTSNNVGKIVGNYDLLQTAVGNLLSNAIKYSKPNSLIQVGAINEGGKVAIYVENTPDQRLNTKDTKQLFERFFQAKEEFRKKGFGLGLAIVKAIMDVHKGDIEVSRIDDRLRFSLKMRP